MLIQFTKWNTATGMRDTLGYHEVTLPAAGTYTEAGIPVNLASQPDTANITFASSYFPDSLFTPQSGSVLLVDDLSFSVPSAVDGSDLSGPHVTAWPNPTTGTVRLRFTGVPCGKRLAIYDAKGVRVRESICDCRGTDVVAAELNGLPDGGCTTCA